MRFFELHFNPQGQQKFLRSGKTPDLVFDSFCYEPGNLYEKKIGSLFVVGELRNVLPQNLKFLDNLALFLKKNYYATPSRVSPETSLKESLKKTNQFLEGIVKEGEVSWLGNINLAIFNLIPQKKSGFEANFTKVGEVKILLLRSGQIIDVGKNLEFSEIEPYPLKIFSNIVAGELAEFDTVAVLTQEVFERFSSQGILKKLAETEPLWQQKKLKEFLNKNEKEFSKISGICLLCFLTDPRNKIKEPKISLTFHKEREKFQLKQVFWPLINDIKKKTMKLSQKMRKLKSPRSLLAVPRMPSLKVHLGESNKIKGLFLRKNAILVMLLVLVLIMGFLLFR